MAEKQEGGMTTGEMVVRLLGYMGGWLKDLPSLFWLLTRRYAVQTLALRTVLLRKGLITEGELEAVEDEVRISLVIDETVGAPAEALAVHMDAFGAGALAVLTAPSLPVPATGEAMQTLRRVIDLTTVEACPLDAIRIGDREYAIRSPLDIPRSEIEEVVRLQAACAGLCWHEQLAVAHRQVQILIPDLPENVLEKLTGRQLMRILVNTVALLPPYLSPAPASAEPEKKE